MPLEVEIAADNMLRAFSLFSRSRASLCTTQCCSVMSRGEWVLWKSASSIWERINHSPARAGSLCQHSCTEKWAAGEILQLVYTEYRTPRPWTFSPLLGLFLHSPSLLSISPLSTQERKQNLYHSALKMLTFHVYRDCLHRKLISYGFKF